MIPNGLANAGGVVVSYLEWVQGLQHHFWRETETTSRLQEIMTRAVDRVWATAEREKVTLSEARQGAPAAMSDGPRRAALDQPRAGRARARRDGAGALLVNSVFRAASQIATAAGCLSFLSTEIA